MIVVSDTSPISNLAVIGHLELLRQLYGNVLIPQAVREELRAFEAIGSTIASADWIEQRAVKNRRFVESLRTQLHPGEAEAIALAVEEAAELLVIDDQRAREIAAEFGLTRIGLLGALLEAKTNGLLEAVRPVLDALVTRAGFWVSHALYQRVIEEAQEA